MDALIDRERLIREDFVKKKIKREKFIINFKQRQKEEFRNKRKENKKENESRTQKKIKEIQIKRRKQ